MKTIKLVLLAAICMVGVLSYASSQKIGDYTWNYRIVDRGAEIYSVSYYDSAVSPKPSGKIEIPPRLGGIPVTSIGYNAFYYCYDMTEVVVPSTVTNVGECAFFNCSKLKGIHFSQGLKRIENGAFSSCRLLEVVDLPSTVEAIGGDAFYACDRIKYITWPPNLSVREHLTQSYDKIETLRIPDGVEEITEGAYSEYYSITSVVFSASVTNIMERAFMSDIGIKEVVLPEGLLAIGAEAFLGCGGIEKLELNEGLESVGDYAFFYCDGIKSISIPHSLSFVGESAFSYCDGLEYVKLFGVDVPVEWTKKFKDFTKEYGDDVVAALRQPTGKEYGDQQMSVWHDYVIGTDPTNKDDVLKTTIVMQNGQPVVNCIPPPRSPSYWGTIYKVWAKKSLDDEEWVEVNDHITADDRFFMVTVEILTEPRGYQGQTTGSPYYN